MGAASHLVALCVAMAAPARAQTASVAGQVTIVERPGAGRSDPRGTVIYLESRRPVAWPAPAAAALASGSIAMRGREFVPHVRVVRTGGTVAFPNQDPFSHNVFSNTDAGAFDLGLYRRGTTRSTTFDQPGVYPIYCNIHARMVSFVIVTPTPHVARAGADGRFVLPDVPAGRYQLRVWHERASDLALDLDVPPAGLSGVRVVLDARQFVPAPHLNKFGLPYTAIRTDRY
jgi:plastocyanin